MSLANDDLWPASIALHVEEACDSFEQACQAGRRPVIEEYLVDTPEPARAVLLRELLALDLAYCRQSEGRPTPEAYARRFPEHVALIGEVFQEMPADSTSLAHQAKNNGGPGRGKYLIRCIDSGLLSPTRGFVRRHSWAQG